MPKREKWTSKIGFILSTAGAAVGLGNLQRFPYMVATNGGAAFLFIYLLCVLLLSIPLMLNEFAIGRAAQKNPVAALESLKPHSAWKYVGALGILTAFAILCYYVVAAGWALSYIFQISTGHLIPYETLAAHPLYSIGSVALILIPTILIVSKGIKGGLEKWSKILMPTLAFLLLLLVVRSLLLPNSFEGLSFYLYPDFSQVTGMTFLYALGQAFFSLCIGEAVLLTYGSYAKKDDNLLSSAGYIALFDTAVAFCAGLVIFPALSAFNQDPHQGSGLIYNVMPHLFLQMPFGNFIGALFFIILTFAALTTCIALLEMPVAYLKESRKWSQKKGAYVMGGIAFLFSIPVALSKGAVDSLTTLKLPILPEVGLYDNMDFFWGGVCMVVSGLLLSIFTGWVWGTKQAIAELEKGAPIFRKFSKLWALIIKYIAPLSIGWILITLFL